MPLTFNMLLRSEGIDPAEVRLLRHQTEKERGRTPYSLWRDDPAAFERYQSVQDVKQRSHFRSAFWASFVAPPGGGTLFVGLYRVKLIGAVAVGAIDAFTGRGIGEEKGWAQYDQYDCILMPDLADYVGRLSIHWGDSASSRRAWKQRAELRDKPIVELLRAFREDPFPGFTNLIRPLSEVETIPPAWKEVLAASRGVYLLACPRTREHYVGSACSAGGFLARWRDYVASGHGGNVGLRIRDPSDFTVSILEVAGSAASEADILAMEAQWKAKLLSRSIGLNRN
ncbi:hypothetical protein ATE68_00075 [Sphingopyxis sp. H038]|uniref:GIY-YIG nuclease family protein n=2 Tax=unclassified Sphingopyxis TaxID=2614943 RepID=UPI00073024F3|nr:MULTISPECIES: GIY-YIG nuclease family protein [unclassified Sphingopyxis]KTE36594.1 hypothetical protein ATE68_00075 [Sphingopyxis sp. H038]KTE61732.1 hypothetical protein ATE74_21025 [Sphingopyxis sp. H085]KTE04104.1 hypothetical protein ATE78_00075 [Sphingopyxis sp. H012]KTE06050.1 hypothetical protein ATE70_23125 [Sphingopyxis sp. H053]KTE15619.1 hypothetical protein ATE76_02255 [Sphingopyxis sp. H093]